MPRQHQGGVFEIVFAHTKGLTHRPVIRKLDATDLFHPLLENMMTFLKPSSPGCQRRVGSEIGARFTDLAGPKADLL
jgi:hypothetical protein